MSRMPKQIDLDQWDALYEELIAEGLREPFYGGPLGRHLEDGDFRLKTLKFDNSAASLHLWNFLLTEEERLSEARKSGKKLIGTMKDLGTVPILAYSMEDVVAFYPDGAWWIPCVMELSAGLLDIADTMGIDQSFCPVRAMLGAFVTEAHFPLPDLLTCSVGAVCDDFSAIAQRIAGLGNPILWWEMPRRRNPEKGEESISLPGGFSAPVSQKDFVLEELNRIKDALEKLTGTTLTEEGLRKGVEAANEIREVIAQLRNKVFTAKVCPMPALEMLVVEMLAIHYCSDRKETLDVVNAIIETVDKRIEQEQGYFGADAAKIFWVNPVADLRAMNLIEESGGRIAGTEYLFCHALDPIPTDTDPMDALAQMALADPMVGSTKERAQRIARDVELFGCEAVVISRIPGASHCAFEGDVIGEVVSEQCDVPVIEIEVPPVSDALRPNMKTRIEALVETVKQRRSNSRKV